MKRGTPEILMVDDDPGIRRVVARALESVNHHVLAVGDRASALQALQDHGAFDLAILDVNLPDANGLDLCEEIRSQYDMPIVMLTVVEDEQDVVRALESGADDYVKKPFGTRELVARIQSVLRRSQKGDKSLQQTIRIGPLQLDSASYRALVHGERLPLTPTEYRLLAFLVQNAGRVLTHDQLLHFVWGTGYEGEHHMLHVTMSRLRQKLGRLEDAGAIRTMPGIGYEFVAGAQGANGNS